MESLHSTFGPELQFKKRTDLKSMAQVVSFNTSKTWSEDEPDAGKWIASLCGRDTRWECIGILFTYCALSSPSYSFARGLQNSLSPPNILEVCGGAETMLTGGLAALPDTRTTAESKISRKSAMVFKEAAQLCADLCKGCVQNSLLLYLSLKISILESMLSGDASPSFWKKW